MDAFIGEIRAFPYNYIPAGWLQCNGQIVSVQQYPALFALIGVKFGGSYPTSFAVPNLSGLAVMGVGQGPGLSYRANGDIYGTTAVPLTAVNLPIHTHDLKIRNATPVTAGQYAQGTPTATSSWLARPVNVTSPTTVAVPNSYTSASVLPNVALAPSTISQAGTGASHPNMQPYLPLVYCINIDGIFPDFN